MEQAVYNDHVLQEENHWWFVSRRAVLTFLISSLKIQENADILDAGCGSGGNLELLSKYGNMHAFEMSDFMKEHSKERGIGQVESGKLPDEIPFADKKFDLITMFDVLEHIEDDNAALKAIAERLKNDGVLFITVPAFGWLFSQHDRLHHHFRRYSKKELQEKMQIAGLEVEFINYWNFILFPVAVATRVIYFFLKGDTVIGTKTPSPFINKLLSKIVSAERFVIPKINLPFGLSLVVIARKKS